MKYVVLVGDGMADKPIRALGYKTCLQAARTPYMDRLASEGQVGRVRTVPRGFDPGSDVANLSILGYDPEQYYTGRAPIEAEYRRIPLGPRDVAFRCNLVTLDYGRSGRRNSAFMRDYSAGHISTEEAATLIREVNRKLGGSKVSFYPGMSYRHLMVWKRGEDGMKCTPPHDISGKKIGAFLPRGEGGDSLLSLMDRSAEILMSHRVNQRRVRQGLNPANSIWLWGQGRRMAIPEFEKKYKVKGALISAVDLTKGLGMCAGFAILRVKGATGYIDTNYRGKAQAALRALKKYDLVYVHVEAPDEAGHNGDVKNKIRAIEDFDKQIVGPVSEGIGAFGDYRILLMPDHFTPIRVKTHTGDPVPFVLYGKSFTREGGKARVRSYSEGICRMKNTLVFEQGHRLMDYFIYGT